MIGYQSVLGTQNMLKMNLNIIFDHIMYILRSHEIYCNGRIFSEKHKKNRFSRKSFLGVKIDIRNRTFCLSIIKSHFLTIYHVLSTF